MAWLPFVFLTVSACSWAVYTRKHICVSVFPALDIFSHSDRCLLSRLNLHHGPVHSSVILGCLPLSRGPPAMKLWFHYLTVDTCSHVLESHDCISFSPILRTQSFKSTATLQGLCHHLKSNMSLIIPLKNSKSHMQSYCGSQTVECKT